MTIGKSRPTFEEIFRKYYRAVFSFFVKKGFSREESEDLSQKTFLRVYENWDDYRADAVWEYLVTVARSVLSNYLRGRSAIKRGHDQTISLDAPGVSEKAVALHGRGAATTPSPFEILELKTNEEWLVAAIAELSEPDRRCVLLWIRGCSFREIGVALKCTPEAAKSRCARIRRKLRRKWAQESRGELRS